MSRSEISFPISARASGRSFAFAAVAAPNALACEAGQSILIEGGNAIEAAIAMAAVLTVTAPHLNSLGGDGFWLIREPDGRMRALEAVGVAQARQRRDQSQRRLAQRGSRFRSVR